MSRGKYRHDARTDKNQALIVQELEKIPGLSVVVGHDDILVGWKGRTYWFEIKSEDALSKKSGKVLESKIRDSQKEIRETWTGHYQIVSSLDEILKTLGIRYG